MKVALTCGNSVRAKTKKVRLQMSINIISAPVARASDPITSDWAGENEKARKGAQTAVQQILWDADYPMSDWQIFQEYSKRCMGSLTQQRLRTARKELQDQGFVEPGGFQYGVSATRGKAMTWGWVDRLAEEARLASAVREELLSVDRHDQKRARVELQKIVGGSIGEESLGLVATVGHLTRKSLRDVTIADLVQMGLVTVRHPKPGEYMVGPRGESQPVSDHSADPLTPEVLS